ncbi:pregnancy-specific beta-1-glycoprotein 8-like [Pimephales promelas]|uniref:pregnancy-specific beta-1-glycoprotein 8-like n=1 Tax=Pimephales promelas TaxID=90988 RepID=UPI0019557526|nr:pregnancy-specific beta-1-glycoprotein 8-like [Pimephales promelas]
MPTDRLLATGDVCERLRKMLRLFAVLCCLWSPVGVFGDVDAVKSVSVTEGDSVTLKPGVATLRDKILWRFGDQGVLIALIDAGQISLYEGPDGRFKDRLKLDLTGSLTITHTRTSDSGPYDVNIKGGAGDQVSKFKLTVYSRLPVPAITRDSSQCSSSSSSSNCSVLCSVLNVNNVTLSWYKGNSLLSSISVSDLRSSISLHLEVEDQDKNPYSCVLNNPITNHSTHLDIRRLCQPCPEIYSCGFAEPVTRLVVAALVGVAAVAFVVYDIRSGYAKKAETSSRGL